MAYIDKGSILAAYKQLSYLDGGNYAQGLTQKASAIRHFIALDEFCEANRTNRLDTRSDDVGHRQDFIKAVGRVCSVLPGLYTPNFHVPLKDDEGDYNVRSNFFSAGQVKNSLQNPKVYNYPTRSGMAVLIHVQNGALLRKRELYRNLKSYLPNPKLVAALIVWLLRNEEVSVDDGKSICENFNEALASIYSEDLLAVLFGDKREISNQLDSYDLKFNDEPCKLTKDDIEDLFELEQEDSTFDNQSASNSSIHSPSDIRNTIFYGPPGTGKTFKMQQIRKGFAEGNAFVVTFHQSFSYEEFVEGLKPVLDSEGQGEIRYRVEAGVFKSACERAASLAGYDSLEECAEDEYGSRKERMEAAVGEGKCVLLCIDEINRGNIAAIFGELISLIEESKRLGAGDEMLVELPYSKTEFGVPMNLWLVGTMNTADRSIQLLDSALRRRFKFSEMLPDYKNFESDEARLVLQNINSRLRCLLGKDSQVGHAYLMKAKTPREILEALVQKVIPLLEEYFYSDTEKVRFVLNEGEGGEAAFYTLDAEAQAAYEEFVTKGDLTDEDKNFYVLNPELNDLEALDDEACEAFLGRLLGTGE